MMSLRYHRLAGPLVVLALSAVTARGEQATPLDTLTSRGLTRTGKYFVVAGEDALFQKLYNLQPLMKEMEAKFEVWAGMLDIENEWQALTDQQLVLRGQLNDINVVIADMRPRSPDMAEAQARRRLTDQQLRDTNTAVAQAAKRRAGPRQLDKAENDFKESREAFVKAKGETAAMYQSVLKEYRELSQDESLKNAMKAHGQASKTTFALGPSEKLQRAWGDVNKYERLYSPETALRPAGKKKRPTLRSLPAQVGATTKSRPRQAPRTSTTTATATPTPPSAKVDLDKAKEQLQLAVDGMKRLRFGPAPDKNAGKNALRRHAIDGMTILLNEMKSGTPTADRLDEVRKDIASLEKETGMRPPALKALKGVLENVDAAAKALGSP